MISDESSYLRQPFRRGLDFQVTRVNYDLRELLARVASLL